MQFIIGDVISQHGSTEAFNAKLKLQLILDPLSYKVDLQSLLERSRGTVWDFSSVDQWLAQCDDLGRGAQALCLSAGAGEGKSSISATLCEHLDKKGIMTAHHFLKYSDARRLDPVRIVKSLLFQLATKLPELWPIVFDLDVEKVVRLNDEHEACSMLLEGPLKALRLKRSEKLGGSPIVILIDALDESDPLIQQFAGGRVQECPQACANRALQV